MGRGDRKTRKGKIAIRSYGNARPHAARKSAGVAAPAAAAVAKPAPRPTARKAAAVKKAAPKKSA